MLVIEITEKNFYHVLDQRLYLSDDRTKKEVAFLDSILQEASAKKVLDLGCGNGRIAIELAKKSYSVLGIDTNKDEVTLAKSKASEAGVDAKFELADFIEFSSDQQYDAALFVYSSFGHLSAEGNLKVLKNVQSNLSEKGTIVIDLLNKKWAQTRSTGIKNLSDIFDLTPLGLKEVYRERKVVTENHQSSYEKSIYTLNYSNGLSTEYIFNHKLHEREEMLCLLEQAGFQNIICYGSFDGRAFKEDSSPRLIIVATKEPNLEQETVPGADTKLSIVDVQNFSDTRNVDISWVGVKGLAYQGLIKMGTEHLILHGKANCGVFLPAAKKGTHMSRMAEGIADLNDQLLSYDTVQKVAFDLYARLETTELNVTIGGTVIRPKISPISMIKGYEAFDMGLEIHIKNQNTHIVMELKVIGTSLCPASKANSKYGAHSQRSLVCLQFPYTQDTEIVSYLTLIEDCLSAKVYPVLKLPDEALVTETAYENAKFVEDIVRSLHIDLQSARLPFIKLSCTNYETIHTHDAYAEIISKY